MFGHSHAKNNSVFIPSSALTTMPLYMKITTDVRARLIYYNIITNNM